MKMFFMSFILCVSSACFVPKAVAQELTATCWQKDCLKFGWSITGAKITEAVENKCRDENCATRGWYGAEYSGLNYYTECMQGQCNKNGYWLIQSYTQKILKTVKCMGPEQAKDCLRYGWEIFSSTLNGKVSCVQNDCSHRGWVYSDSSFKSHRVTCNNGDCFVNGWQQTEH